MAIASIKKAREDTRKYGNLSLGDRRIYLVQRGTKTTYKPLTSFHNSCRLRHSWYYRWHCHPHHKKVHWALVVAYLILIAVFFYRYVPASLKKSVATGNAGTAQIQITIPQDTKTIPSGFFGNNLTWQSLPYIAVDRYNPQQGIVSQFEDKLKALNISVMRMNAGEGWYRWFKGVGPLANRQASAMVDNYGNTKIGYFGTDEYLTLMQKLDVKDVMITVNYAGGFMTYSAEKKAMTGTYVSGMGAQEAANWVEYCNGIIPSGTDTSGWTVPDIVLEPNWGAEVKPAGYFAWLRAQPTYGNHPDPYGVKYWEIGNEVYWGDRYLTNFVQPVDPQNSSGPTDGGSKNYADDLIVFSEKMKAIDSAIKIGAVSVDEILSSYPAWNSDILETSSTNIDFFSIHTYNTLKGLTFELLNNANKPAKRTINTTEGNHEIKIITSGQTAVQNGQTIKPILELRIDGNVVQTWDIDVNIDEKSYSGNFTAGEHEIQINFINDYFESNANDRNLFVYKGTVDGVDFLFPKDTEQQWLFYDRTIQNTIYDRLKSKIADSNNPALEMIITEANSGDYYDRLGLGSDYDQTRDQNFSPPYSHQMGATLWLSMLLNTLIERNDVSLFQPWIAMDSGNWGFIRYYSRPNMSFKKNDDGSPYIITNPSYDLLKLYQKYIGWSILNTGISSEEYSWPKFADNTTPWPAPDSVSNSWITGSQTPYPSGVKYVDGISMLSTDKDKMAVILTNRSDKQINTSVGINGCSSVISASGKQLKVKSFGDHSGLTDTAKALRNYDPYFNAHNETETVNSQLPIISDNVGIEDINITTSSSGVPEIMLPPDSVTVIEISLTRVSLSSNNFSTSWNMVSFPDISAAITNKTLLPGTYKIRKYDSSINNYVKGENTDIVLTPGAGYWLKVDDISLLNGIKYISKSVSQVEASVSKGWALLGNPFQSDLPLSNLVVKYKDGSLRSYEEAILRKEVSGYAWSWESTTVPKAYHFIAIEPDRYKTSSLKKTFISPYRGFWIIVKSDQISSIIMNK